MSKLITKLKSAIFIELTKAFMTKLSLNNRIECIVDKSERETDEEEEDDVDSWTMNEFDRARQSS